MGKKTKKKLHYFTLSTEINDIFEKYIDDNCIDKTKLLENLIVKYLEDKKIINTNND